MPTPWTLIDRVDTPEGPLELRARGERDLMILHAGRVLMSSRIHRSELALATLGCAPIADRPAPRVLIGGLGLGFTLRAALDALPKKARVVVAELNATVVKWCEGPAAIVTKSAVRDPRVKVEIANVTRLIREAATGKTKPFDAIILDLYEGPRDGRTAHRDPLYGNAITEQVHAALADRGVYAVWGEERCRSFESRLEAGDFEIRYERSRGGGPRHAVYVAQKKKQKRDPKKLKPSA
jgi:spermidine synthase